MDPSKTLFVVHTMGRVGSRAIMKSLQEYQELTGEVVNRIHCHHLTFPDSDHDLEARRAIRKWTGKKVVISAVRDPIARNLSAFWNNYVLTSRCGGTLDQFLFTYPHRVPLDFYLGEYAQFWNIPKWDNFIHDDHHISFESGGVDHIIFKDISWWMDIMEDETGLKFNDLDVLGRTGDMGYLKFLDTIELPKRYTLEILSSWFTNYFFSEEDTDMMWDRWKSYG